MNMIFPRTARWISRYWFSSVEHLFEENIYIAIVLSHLFGKVLFLLHDALDQCRVTPEKSKRLTGTAVIDQAHDVEMEDAQCLRQVDLSVVALNSS